MSKKTIIFPIIFGMLLTSCDFLDFSNNSEQEFVPAEKQEEDKTPQPDPITFSIISAQFTDDSGHLRVNYTCSYESPFDIPGHEYHHLNVTGVTASEVNTTHQGYFTLVSPIINTTLKFEFYDVNNDVYISYRCENVTLYDDDNPNPVPQIDYPKGYSTLYWSDEFNGTSLDTSKWTYEIGNGEGGWGNGESQYYTNSNDKVENGVLTLKAKKQQVDSFSYTSTRIKTQNKVHFTYGYVEASIALPTIQGMWPAFWMMPNDSYYGGWPHSGEIDIMEARGRINSVSSSAIHFSTNSGNHTYLTDEKTGHNIAMFHKYAVEWKADTISFFVDNVKYFTTYKYQWSTVSALTSETAPFDKDFYIILNLAIGGHFDNWRMPPDDFIDANMNIDYVRVFK